MLAVLAAVTGSSALALEIRRAKSHSGQKVQLKQAEESIQRLTEALDEAEANWRKAEAHVQVRCNSHRMLRTPITNEVWCYAASDRPANE